MGQWGKIKKIGSMVFMPHVKANPFDPILCDSMIDDIFLMKNGNDEILADKTLLELKEQYVGEFYNKW